MFDQLNRTMRDQLRPRIPGDGLEHKAHRLFRAVERARLQFLQKNTRSRSSRPISITGSYIDLLPAELVVQVLAECGWRDLVALRLVSRAFKEIVDMHEHVIVQSMLRPGTDRALLSTLFAPPKSRGPEGEIVRRPTLQYIHSLEKRHTTCSQLAYYLCTRAIAPMFDRQFAGTIKISKQVRREIDDRKEQAVSIVRRRLTKQLYYVYHFLTYTRLRLEAALTSSENEDIPIKLSELSAMYREIQCAIIQSFPNSILISTYHAMNFLVNSLRIAISPEPPHNANDDTVSLMLRCATSLQRCVEFLVADSPSAPSRLRRQFMEDMQGERYYAENRGMDLQRLKTQKGKSRRSTSISSGPAEGVWSPRIADIWFVNARAEMERRGIKTHTPDGVYFFPEIQEELLIGCPDCQTR